MSTKILDMLIKDKQIINDYLTTKSIYKTAKNINKSFQSVHGTLVKHGVKRFKKIYGKEVHEYIKVNYSILAPLGKTKKICDKYNISRITLLRIARKYNLTNLPKNRDYTKTEEVRIQKREWMKKWYKEHEHPKGMLGKHHTKEYCKVLGQMAKERWADPNNVINSKEYRQSLSNRAQKSIIKRIKSGENMYSRCKRGWYDFDNNKKYFMRSSWENNYAKYLDFLVLKNNIKSWEYEVDTFWFDKIKRGVRSYTPDFKIININDTVEYHEVKGWMDKKSKTKIKRMAKYYSNVKLVIIDSEAYKNIMKYSALFLK